MSRNILCSGPKYRLLANFLDSIHRIIRIFSFKKKERPIRRILLCNWASLGDVLLSTSVISAIRNQYPDVKIGFLVSKKSKIVLETAPHVDWIHEVDGLAGHHKSLFSKIFSIVLFPFFEKKEIVREIKKIDYDSAIELSPFFPNTIPILHSAKIPLRLGFDTGGNSFLLEKVGEWEKDRYLLFQYPHLLNKMGIKMTGLHPVIIKKPIDLQLQEPYILFHPCSSLSEKEFPSSFWKSLYELCNKENITIYFTGLGEKELAFISKIGVDDQFNLCDKLSWTKLLSAIEKSKGVVSVDSVPVHIAFTLGRPCVVLYKKFHKIWFPESLDIIKMEDPIEPAEIVKMIHTWQV